SLDHQPGGNQPETIFPSRHGSMNAVRYVVLRQNSRRRRRRHSVPCSNHSTITEPCRWADAFSYNGQIFSDATSRFWPPTNTCELEGHTLDLGVSSILCQFFLLHNPVDFALPALGHLLQMCQGGEKEPDPAPVVYHDGLVRDAVERLAGCDRLVKTSGDYADGVARLSATPASARHRDPHQFVGTPVSCNEVNPRMIDAGALESVTRQPVEHESFPEVPGDLGMPGTPVNIGKWIGAQTLRSLVDLEPLIDNS